MSIKNAASQYLFSTLRSLAQVLLAVGVLAFLFALVGGESAAGVRRAIANISQGLLFGAHQTTGAGYAARPIQRYTPRAAPVQSAPQTRQPPQQPGVQQPAAAPYNAGQSAYTPSAPAPQVYRQPTVYVAARQTPPPCVTPVSITCDAPLSRPIARRAAPAQPMPPPQPAMRPYAAPRPQMRPYAAPRPQMRPYAAQPAARAAPAPRRLAPVIADPAQWRRAFESAIAAQGFRLPADAEWATYVADYWRVMIDRWPYRLEAPYFCVDPQRRRVLTTHRDVKPPGCESTQREADRLLNLDALPRAAPIGRAESSTAATPGGAGSAGASSP